MIEKLQWLFLDKTIEDQQWIRVLLILSIQLWKNYIILYL